MNPTCHGCHQSLEPATQVRTYHSQCDPQGRVEMLERALSTILPLAEHFPCGIEGSEGAREMQRLCAKIAAEARAALVYRPAQMKGREE